MSAAAQSAKEQAREFRPDAARRAEAARLRGALEATVKDRPPSIKLLPFHVDPALDFNEWLVEFLPPRP